MRSNLSYLGEKKIGGKAVALNNKFWRARSVLKQGVKGKKRELTNLP